MTISKKQLALGAAFAFTLAGCTTLEQVADSAGTVAADTVAQSLSTVEPEDPRNNLTPGIFDAGTASWNLELVSNAPPAPGFYDEDNLWSRPPPPPETPDTAAAPDEEAQAASAENSETEEAPPPPRRSPIAFANTDLAFSGNRIVMGNFHGFNVFEVSNGSDLDLILSVACPGGQGDVTIKGDLVFYSVEQNSARLDCAGGGVEGDTSAERFRGIRIFDISKLDDPQQVAAVQTCRGSHTNTLIPHVSDPNIVYIYNSGISTVRPDTELEGCFDAQADENPNTARFSIDIIKVELDAPQNAAILSSPRIFADLETGNIDGLWKGGAIEEGAQRTSSTNACHDMTAYPEYNLLGGACAGNGIILDISDRENPKRIDDIFDRNMAFWHSANFSNDASKIIFTDEWGGGTNPRCRADDPKNWGANIILDRTEDGLVPRSYYKLPSIQTEQENCVAHNGSLVPIPGRDIMVQAWYSGGVSIFDFTDSENPFEIAYFDRGPLNAEQMFLAGNWAAYWHNGQIYAPEIVRGLDVFHLVASEHLSENEIAAAKLIHFEEANTQTQLKFEWPAHPAVAGSYIDQLERSKTLDADLLTRARKEVERWGKGRQSSSKLSALAVELNNSATDITGRDAKRIAKLARLLSNVN